MVVGSMSRPKVTACEDAPTRPGGVRLDFGEASMTKTDGLPAGAEFGLRMASGLVIGRERFQNQHLGGSVDKPSTREMVLVPFLVLNFLLSLSIYAVLRATCSAKLKEKANRAMELRERALLVNYVLDWFEILFDVSTIFLTVGAYFCLPSSVNVVTWMFIAWGSRRIKVKVFEKDAYISRLINRANNSTLDPDTVRILETLPEKSKAWLYPIRITLALQNKAHERRASAKSLEDDLLRT